MSKNLKKLSLAAVFGAVLLGSVAIAGPASAQSWGGIEGCRHIPAANHGGQIVSMGRDGFIYEHRNGSWGTYREVWNNQQSRIGCQFMLTQQPKPPVEEKEPEKPAPVPIQDAYEVRPSSGGGSASIGGGGVSFIGGGSSSGGSTVLYGKVGAVENISAE